MDWQPAPDRLMDLIQDEFDEPVCEAEYARLPFYSDGYLVRANVLEIGYVDVVLGGAMGGVATSVLNGKSGQLVVANRIAGLSLTRENAAAYVRFYCDHLHTETGEPFKVVEHWAHRPHRSLATRIRHQAADGTFWVGAYQTYQNLMFRVSLRVRLDGRLEMAKDACLGSAVRVLN